jgi:hypothetical protein
MGRRPCLLAGKARSPGVPGSLDDEGAYGFSRILKDIAAKLLDAEEALGDKK